MSSEAYTPATAVNDLKWFRPHGSWHFECQVEVKLSQYQRLQPGDLAVLSLERAGECSTLQGTLLKVKPYKKSSIVEVELSKIAELAWQAQDFSLDGTSTWRLHFILIPPNEKKSIQLLQGHAEVLPVARHALDHSEKYKGDEERDGDAALGDYFRGNDVSQTNPSVPFFKAALQVS